MFTLTFLEAFPGWFASVESHKILGWFGLFLFGIAIYCFTVFVGSNCYTRLVNVKPRTSKSGVVSICVSSKLQVLGKSI